MAPAEPVSPSAVSEMTSMTQGSTAAESSSSFGPPATPSSSFSTLDRERLTNADGLNSYSLRSARSPAGTELHPSDKVDLQNDVHALPESNANLSEPHS